MGYSSLSVWSTLLLLLVLLISARRSHAFSATKTAKPPSSSAAGRLATVPVNPDTMSITEDLCLDTARRLRRIKVPVTSDIHPDGQVAISYAEWKAQGKSSNSAAPPLFLIHGFDSSALEYRRLGGQLAQRGIDTYAVDLLGWGFSQLKGVTSFSAEAKVQSLVSFIETIVGKDAPFLIAGASLGGAAAIETAARSPNCKGLILLDAQGFVDGIGPMSFMPKPVAALGVQVLKSVPLRSSANQMSYYDKKTYATDEAVVVGRLHCLQDGWDDALVSFMQSGGFSPSKKVPTIQVPSLVLWGRQDTILDGKEFATKFIETLPDATLKWVEECGHVPHLEQPQETANAIADFLQERIQGRQGFDATLTATTPAVVGIGVISLAAGVAALVADLLPVH